MLLFSGMQWYFSKGGAQQGPVSTDELRSKISSGEVSAADLVWKEGMADWTPAAKVAELAVHAAAPLAPPPVSTPVAAPTYQQSPYNPPQSPVVSAPQGAGGDIPNYLWQSIVVTILCCWPLGIPAIIFAAKVDGLKARGEIDAARAASANAKKWTTIALVSGIVVIIGVIILQVIAAVAASQGAH